MLGLGLADCGGETRVLFWAVTGRGSRPRAHLEQAAAGHAEPRKTDRSEDVLVEKLQKSCNGQV